MNGGRNADAGGRLSTSTNRSGNTTSYEYDDAGRTTKITRTGFGGFQQITKYDYGATVNDHLDTRPTKVTEQLRNVTTGITTTLSGTTYEYQDDTSFGRTETVTQTVNGVADHQTLLVAGFQYGGIRTPDVRTSSGRDHDALRVFPHQH